jgi:riboflavin kinase/FMN adenylyltransferase
MFRVFRSLAKIGPDARPSAVAVGNFDGVHTGHRRLFRRAVRKSQENGWRPSVLTFDPHPTRVVAPDRAPRLLNTNEQRWELMREEGIEQVFVLPFDRDFATQTPSQFVRGVLVEGVGAAAVFVGENFRFGARQAGDVDLLQQLGGELGLCVEVVPSIYIRGRMASSTEVRRLIEAGNVSLACRLLERPYSVEGEIVSGHGIGSKQTVPTLNLDTVAEVLPADGVYITRTTDTEDGRVWQSITNIGMRPTFQGDRRTIETFLLSPFDGRTPERIRLAFCKRVREERKFESPDALKGQILRDVAVANRFFRRTSVVNYGLPHSRLRTFPREE